MLSISVRSVAVGGGAGLYMYNIVVKK